MPLLQLDHVNLRTARVKDMLEWYERVLGLKRGPRPAFPFSGAWLYCGAQPVVHLVGVAEEIDVTEVKLEHFAFRASGLAEFVGALRVAKEPYEVRRVPGVKGGTEVVQVNLWDPDGNHIHIDFDASEAEGMKL